MGKKASQSEEYKGILTADITIITIIVSRFYF